MKLTGKNLRKIIRKRLIANCINFFITSSIGLALIGLPLLFLDNDKGFSMSGLPALIAILIVIFVSTYLHFGLFTKITKGYTIGGLLVGLKIINTKGHPMSSTDYFKRALSGYLAPSKFLLFSSVKYNSLGQFYYDRKYDTTVLDKKFDIYQLDFENIRYYEANYLKKPILIIILFFIALKMIENITSL